jgi:class 3 adenylate cyclase
MDRLPTGTVTFLFTDIEGSTPLWEQHPAAMTAALARHDALMRRTMASHLGYVFKTVGDAFCVAFGTALDALKAALAVQRELPALNDELDPARSVEGLRSPIEIRVRVGVHTGEAVEHDGDYFGTAVNAPRASCRSRTAGRSWPRG